MNSFKKGIFFSSFGLIIFGTFLVYIMIQEGEPLLKEEESSLVFKSQELNQTKKILLLSKEGKREVGELNTKSSLLKKEGDQFIEEMKGLHLLFQENFNKQGQRVLFLEAEEGSFYYSKEKLTLKNLIFKRYQLEGFLFPKEPILIEPLLEGSAESGLGLFSQKNPEFTFEKMKVKTSFGSVQGKIGSFELDPLGKVQDIALTEEVLMDVLNLGTINSSFLKANLKTNSLVLHGNSEMKVKFNAAKRPFELQGERMDLEFQGEKLLKLVATDSVEIKEKGEKILAYQAVFFDPDEKGQFTKVDLTSENEKTPCKVFTSKGLELTSSTMRMNGKEEELTLQEPVRGNYENAFGNFENEVKIKKKEGGEEIVSKGLSKLTFDDVLNGKQTLEVFGEVLVDTKGQFVHLKSETVSPFRLIHFYNSFGDVYGKDAVLTFRKEESRFVPLYLVLKGDVLLQYKKPLSEVFALADQLEYDFLTEKLILKGNGKKRVLFFDKLNQMEASAELLIITKDLNSGKPIVEGKGDVHFKFSADELIELKSRFTLDR